MDQDESIKYTEPPLAIKESFYKKYVRPHIKIKPTDEYYEYLLNQSYHAWHLRIHNAEIKKMLFVEHMCEELVEAYEKDFVQLASGLLQETHDTHMRSVIPEKNVCRAERSKKNRRVFFREY